MPGMVTVNSQGTGGVKVEEGRREEEGLGINQL
jgi:hypothetical protein